ncbi:MAG: hypothetical protein ACOVNY_05960 [Chitinophagaceae bacterium]
MAFAVIALNAYFDWKKELFLSSYTSIIGAIVMLAVVAYVYLGYKKYVAGFCIFLFNFLFIAYTVFEGLATGAYLYFFPLMLVMTFMLIESTNKKIQILTLFGVIVVSFCLAIFYADYESSYQKISTALAQQIFIINALSAVFLCAIFAYIAVVYDRKMKAVLLVERNKVDEHALKVKQQNAQLKDITFITAHSVRAPLTNILGLINLLQNKQLSETEKDKIVSYLLHSSQTLDVVLKDVIKKSAQVEDTLMIDEIDA